MPGIDPLRLAAFMVLPGAEELVEAYSSIRPGPMRDSLVHLAKTYAEGENWTPPHPFEARPEPARLEAPTPPLVMASQEGQIIERIMLGEAPHAVADATGVRLGVVMRLMRAARREGGVVFPGDDDPGAARPTKSGKARKTKTKVKPKKFRPARVPDPPYWWEDPNSPIWDDPEDLPTQADDPKGSMAAMGPIDRRSYSTMKRAAEAHGMTLRQYMAQRFEIVRRVEAGETPTKVAIDLRVVPYTIYGLLARIGRSRMDTLNARPLPTPSDGPEPGSEPPAATALRQTPETAQEAASGDLRVLSARKLAAARWGFESIEAWDAMRIRVRDFRMRGWPPSQIADALHTDPQFVKATLQYWRREQGVTFPNVFEVAA